MVFSINQHLDHVPGPPGTCPRFLRRLQLSRPDVIEEVQQAEPSPEKKGIPGLLTHKLLYPISLVLWRTLTHFSERHFWGLVNRYVVLLHLVIWIDVLMEFPLFHIELPENSGCPKGSWRHFVPRGSRWTAVLPRTLRKSHVLELWEDHRILLTDWQGWTQATVRLVSA